MAKAPWSQYQFDPVGALRNFQEGPDFPRPNIIAQQIPVVGSAWQAVGDLQDGEYLNAALNAGMAVAEATPLVPIVRGVRAAKMGMGVMKKGSLTANAAQKAVHRARRRAGVSKPPEEVHHTIPLNGTPRNVPDWRNHYVFLKPLPKENHRRLTGSYTPPGSTVTLPRYGPALRVWHGTNDWQKAAPTGLLGYTISSTENTQRASPGRVSPPPPTARRPAAGAQRPATTGRSR